MQAGHHPPPSGPLDDLPRVRPDGAPRAGRADGPRVGLDDGARVGLDEVPRVVGLLGYPARYSLSPAMHNAAFRACGLAWVYTLFPVPPEQLADAVRGMRALALAGANVTIPHKEAVAALVDELSPEAHRCGAVNTLVWQEGRLVGHNTDVGGFARAAAEAGVRLRGSLLLVLGSGGAARAVVVAAGQAQAAEVWVAGRQPERAERLVRGLQAHFPATRMATARLEPDTLRTLMARADLVVNTTPLGTLGEGATTLLELAHPGWLKEGGALMDLVYRPLLTPWVEVARARGLRAWSGGLMLLYQGALAFELWTGLPAPVQAMRRALEEALGGPLAPEHTSPGPAA